MNFVSTFTKYPRGCITRIGFLPTLLLLIFLGILLSRVTLMLLIPPTPPLESIQTCFPSNKQSNVSEFANCLRPVVRSLMRTYSTSEIQNYSVATSSPTIIQDNCHPIQHIIGELTYKTSPSLERAMSRCDSSCRNGCVHGAMGAAVTSEMGEVYPDEDIPHMSVEELRTLGEKYCESSISICHGIGHIFFIQLADYQKSFEGCDAVSSGFARETCYQGVFMEDIGGFDSVTLTSAHTKTPPDDYRSPCAAIAPKYQHACFQFLSKFQLLLVQSKSKDETAQYMDKSTSVRTCETFTGRARAYCFEGMGTVHLITYGAYGTMRDTFCNDLSLESDRLSCTTGVSATITYEFQWPELIAYCDAQRDSALHAICYDTTFQILMAEPHMGEKYIANVCESEKSESCAEAFQRFLSVRATLPDYRFGIFGESEE